MVYMVSLSTSTSHAHPLPSAFNRRPADRTVKVRCISISPREPKHTISFDKSNNSSLRGTRQSKWLMNTEDVKEVDSKETKEDVNTRIASRKAISIILRREATKAIIEKKKGSKKLLQMGICASGV